MTQQKAKKLAMEKRRELGIYEYGVCQIDDMYVVVHLPTKNHVDSFVFAK